VITEGHATNFFGDAAPAGNEPEEEEERENLPADVAVNASRGEDIQSLWNQGFDVNDDNEPAPENIPTGAPTIPAGQTWEVRSIETRATEGNDYRCPPKLNNISDAE
jgi:hypothetical protein